MSAEKEIELMQKDILIVRSKNQKMFNAITFGCVLFLVVLIFGIILYKKNRLLIKRNIELKRMNDFKDDAYLKLTNDISNVLNDLALTISKVSYTPEYSEISNIYSEFAENYNNLVCTFNKEGDFNNN
jgi:hypothetical protein